MIAPALPSTGLDWPGRATVAEIDLDAIAHNARQFRALAPAAGLVGVVKANGYGHGAVPVARTLVETGACALAVACVDEGIELRRAGLTVPILVLGYTAPAEAAVAVAHHLTPLVATDAVAAAVSTAAIRQGVDVPVHVKVDTGMGRYGLLPAAVTPFLQWLAGLPRLTVDGIATHFASADAADLTPTERQLALFLEVVAAAERAGLRPRVRHGANSAAALRLPAAHLDLIRPGLALYGVDPAPPAAAGRLQPALTLRSRVARVADLPAGASVSYGGTWTAPRASRVAVVPAGYADGVPRLLSNRGAALVRGRCAPIAGRVCMDALMLDVTEIPAVAEGDEVVLIGRQGDAAITVEDIAAWADTIPYEVLTRLSARVPRRYWRDRAPAAATTLVADESSAVRASG